MKIQLTKQEFFDASVKCSETKSGIANSRCSKCVLYSACGNNKSFADIVTEIYLEELKMPDGMDTLGVAE